MNITALLSWYDEPPEFLERSISTLAKAGVTRLIALDGAYADYPDGKPTSSFEQCWTLQQSAKEADIQCSDIPAYTLWPTEMEKRTALFRLAERDAPESDWYYVVDADEEILTAPADLHARLDQDVFDVADCILIEPAKSMPFPKFFRAIPGLEVVGNHFTYKTPDDRYLWGNATNTRLEPRAFIHDMRVYHHIDKRPPERNEARKRYYRTRDDTGIERHHSAHLAA